MKNLVNVEKIEKAVKGLKKVKIMLMVITIILSLGSFVFAGTDNPLTVVNNLSDFMFGLIKAIGIILLAWGIVQIGLSFKSHDASQRANSFLTVAGGIVILFTKEILNLITA